MCGITGIFGPFPARSARVSEMTSMLHHRGPDGSGIWDAPELTFGHTRLQIVDLSPGGAQPMHRGKYSVVFNGEIYNWKRLRTELEESGVAFRSMSDTELLLAMYERFGIRMLDRLEGMFAFALWDGEASILHLVRDRYGVKPLLYAELNGAIAFASELRCFRSFEGLHRLDHEALSVYLSTNYIPAPHTIWQGVRRLPPGSRMEMRPGVSGGKILAWFDPVEAAGREGSSAPEDVAETLRGVLEDAVDLRLDADVPVGVFLSGGIDSSIVTALAAFRRDKVISLNVGYENAPQLDEREAARAVASFLGTDHREIRITAEEAKLGVTEVLDHLDEPFADDSLIPTYLLSKAASQEVKVVLSGDGGDELFGGYTKYLGYRWAALPGVPRVAASVRPFLTRVPTGRTHLLPNLARAALRFVDGAGGEFVDRHRSWVGLLDRSSMNGMSLLGWAGDPLGEQLSRLLLKTAHWSDDIARAMIADIGYVLPYNMLEKVDRASMWNSLEVRSPFLDSRLLALAFSLPGKAHVGLFGTKQFLRRVGADLLPPATLRRRKRGFGIPLGDWLRTDLKWLLDRLSRADVEAVGLIDPDGVNAMVADHLSGRRDRSWELWNLIVLQTWAKQYPWSA